MDNYQHILFVTNCTKQDEAALVQQVRQLAVEPTTRISLLYVVPAIPAYYLQCPASLELEKQLKLKAQKHLAKLKTHFVGYQLNSYIRTGDFDREIEDLAQQLQVDLVVMAQDHHYSLWHRLCDKLLQRKWHPKHKKVCIHWISA